MDPKPNPIQPNETPKTTLDRTRQLLARSRLTLDAASRRLGAHDDEERPLRNEPPQPQPEA